MKYLIDLFTLQKDKKEKHEYTVKASKFKQNRRKELKVSHCKK